MLQLRQCALPLLLSLGGCVGEVDAATPIYAAQDTALSTSPDLSRGQRRTLVDGIVAAENQLFTSTGRLFVSGDEGVFEITRQGTQYSSRKLQSDAKCQFGGLTEHASTLYANCYDGQDSKLYAAPLGETPELRAIHALPGVGLANGLTSDEDGNLYVASSFDGSILRLKLEPGNPLAVSAQDTWLANSGLVTNGIKYFEGELFWTAFTTLKSARLRPDGLPGRQRDLFSALTFFDDLYASEDGFLLDDYLNGRVISVDATGRNRSGTPISTFDGPSSVQPAQGRLGLPQNALVVTERNAGRLSLFEP
jgi:outer membrane protein assembly factor BamB